MRLLEKLRKSDGLIAVFLSVCSLFARCCFLAWRALCLYDVCKKHTVRCGFYVRIFCELIEDVYYMKKLVISIILIAVLVISGGVAMAAGNEGLNETYSRELTVDGESYALEQGSEEYFRVYGYAPGTAGFSVQFFVEDADGKPMEGASVNIDGTNRAITNANGAASVKLVNGTYNYEIVKSSYETATGRFTVSGKDVSLPAVKMAKLSCLTFSVTDGNIGIDGAQISVAGQSIATNSSGKAIFWVKDGSYDYSVFRRGLERVAANVAVTGDTNVSVDIPGSLRVEFNVTDDAGKPVAGAEVAVAGARNVYTDGNGKAYTWVTEGTHRYAVSQEQCKDVFGSFAADEKLNIVNISMERMRFAALFTVKDNAGAPLEGVKITIPGKEAVTDASGSAAIAELLPGIYEISVSKDGYESYAGEFTVGGKTARITVVLVKTVPVPTPEPTPVPTPVPTENPTPAPVPTTKPTARPTVKPTASATAKPTATAKATASAKPSATASPSASPSPKKTPVIASAQPSVPPQNPTPPAAGTTETPSAAPTDAQTGGALSVGFNFVDANGEPLVDYITELHSDPQSGRTDADGYIFYMDVPPGAHTLYLKNSDNTVLAKKDFMLDYAAATSHQQTDLGVDAFNVKDSVNAVTVDVIYNEGQLTLANVHEGWSQFYSELPSEANNKLNTDLVFWLIIGLAVLILVLVILIVVKRNSIRTTTKKRDYLQGGFR